jgi:hypothetical protein
MALNPARESCAREGRPHVAHMKSPYPSRRPIRWMATRGLLVFSTCVWGSAFAHADSEAGAARRVLEISTPSVGDELYARQAAWVLPHWRGLLERDMEIVTREGATAFKVRLIGKDGGEKRVSTEPVTMTEVFALIDAMPMRREEMKNARRRE